MDELMKQALEKHKIIRYVPTFLQVLTTYKKLLDVQNEALDKPDVSGRSEQLKGVLQKLLEGNMCSVRGDELIEEALASL